MKILRKKTSVINVWWILIGWNNPISIQSMTNTRTSNIEETIKQIEELKKVWCEIVRLAVLNEEDAYAIKKIKEKVDIPLVADIHFDYRLALISIESWIDKLRINPGNIWKIENVELLVEKCREKNIPIRIWVNLGSLDKNIEEEYWRTAKALVESAKGHVAILENLNFKDIAISLKASDVMTCVEAYKLASDVFEYPLHIWITEAGSEFAWTIKSSIGLWILLSEWIGDTMRVSLSCPPVKEIRVAKEILNTFWLYKKPTLIACPTCGRLQYNMLPIVKEIEDFLDSLWNVDIKVAVMWCAVNWPWEARDADIWVAGWVKEALLFKKWEIVRKIPQEKITEELKKEILEMIKKEDL